MKKSKMKCLALLGSTMVAGALASCAGGSSSSSSTITTVSILVFNGTGGKDWVTNATKRFAEANKDVSFEEGKTGINFKIRSAKGLVWNTEMKSSGEDIFIYESNPDIYQLAAQGYLLNLDDVVKPMESKIQSDMLERLKGPDGHYYALPHYEWFPGVTYDKDLFDEKNFYFADPSADAEDKEHYTSKYGDADFVADSKVTKSVGPNGIRGDYDDGLPSSLQEFNILCDKMYSLGVSPLLLHGAGQYYSWYLPMAMWASLTGEAMSDIYCDWSSSPVDVVTGWSDEEAFYSGSGIKKPTVSSMTLTDESGYQMYNMANRYYSLAYFQMALANKWIDSEQLTNPQGSSTEAMNWFVNGHNTKRYGMLWDGSYWCHEAADVGTFKLYSQMNGGAKRHTSFMPLPTQLTGQVEEGKGKKPTLLNVGNTVAFANSRAATNGKEKAVKEFLSFIYSDSELAAFSELTGLTAPVSYSYDMSKLDNSYYEDLATLRKDANVIQCSSSSTRLKKNYSSFLVSYNMQLNNFTAPNGTLVQGGYLSAFQHLNCTAEYIFNQTKLNQDNWNAMSK